MWALQLDPRRMARFKKKLKNFRISPDRIADFEEVLDYRNQVELVVVEMPTHPVFKSFYGGGEEVQLEISKAVRTITESRDIVYIPGDNPEFDSDELWLQSNHMNALGAEHFSIWLGNKIGEHLKTGLLKEPVT